MKEIHLEYTKYIVMICAIGHNVWFKDTECTDLEGALNRRLWLLKNCKVNVEVEERFIKRTIYKFEEGEE